MQLKSVETTPNPNSMKLNLNESIGATATYSPENKTDCPELIGKLLAIDGIKSVFACNDFVTLNRDPRADWRLILDKATKMFDAREDSAPQSESEQARAAFEKEGQVQVLVQTFKGVPIQVKALDGGGETRISLGERFNEIALAIQNETGADFLKERYWADHGVRYGDRVEVANEVAAELQGTFSVETLERVRVSATSGVEQPAIAEDVLISWLSDQDWHKRLSAVQELKATEVTVPLLAKALEDENPQVRRLAAAALGTTGSVEAIPALCHALLNDQHVGVRRTAGDALSDIGDPLAEPAMCEALSDKNKLVRWRAARYLFDVGTTEAIPYLEKAINDTEFEVRLEVEAAIERIREGLQGIGPAWKRIVENRE
jgi:HEAT repeat protein